MSENVNVQTDEVKEKSNVEECEELCDENTLNQDASEQESQNGAENKVSFEEQLKEANDKYYYVLAELENSRKRFEREKESLIKYGNEKVLNGLIDVVDNFERILDALKMDEDPKMKNTFVGMQMVCDQFLSVLSANGLSVAKADEGQDFDPNLHEAMGQEETGTPNKVVRVFQKGYLLNGRLLRASKVIVSK